MNYRLPLALTAAAICTFSQPTAQAHFVLKAPQSWMSQGPTGMPQKMGPCGNEGGGTETGAITPFQPGETITITIDETIHHPGHYRVALAVNDQSEIPAEPPVTPGGGSDCGSAPVQDPPVFPVLADGVLEHTGPFNGPQSIQVTLPTDVTCENCTLQVLEFMSSHGAPCFYHHCATISIGSATGPTGSGSGSGTGPTGAGAGATSGPGAGVGGAGVTSGGGQEPTNPDDPSSGDDGGCSCSVPAGKSPMALGFGAALMVMSMLRRRARRSRLRE